MVELLSNLVEIVYIIWGGRFGLVWFCLFDAEEGINWKIYNDM